MKKITITYVKPDELERLFMDNMEKKITALIYEAYLEDKKKVG